MYSQIDQSTNVSNSTIDTNIVPRRHGVRKFRNVYSTYTPNHRFSRYNNTLVGLWPIRFKENTSELLVESSGFFSFMTFHWVISYLTESLRKNKNEIPIPRCPNVDSCKINSIRLDGLFNNQALKQGYNNLSILRVVLNFVRTRMIFACILYILAALISMLGLVLFLPNILKFVDIFTSIQYVILLVSCELFSCFLYSASNAINLRTAIRLRSGCFASLYRQALHTTLTYNISSWQLVSFILSEGQHVHNLVMAIPNLICTPIILICCLLFAGTYLHLWGYLSVLIIIGLFPIFILIALFSNKLLYKATFFSDQRVKILEEFILNNLYVKFQKLEKRFKNNIANARENEVNCIKKVGLYDNLCFSFILLQPFLSLVALYVGGYYYYKDISISTFAAISIILLIHVKQSLDNFWYGLNNFFKGIAALKKYKKLKLHETISLNHKKPSNENLVICIEEASFQWTKRNTLNVNNSNAKILFDIRETLLNLPKNPPTEDILHDINMDVEHGKLIGICGMSGSGRSSLLLAIMGLLIKSKGKRYTSGHFAYINQEPLIFNDSVKNNILFGNPLDSQRYYRVTIFSGLHEIFSCLPDLDDTIITSKLITFEQKQRIVLARTLYENADIYLLDQPLSALNYSQSLRIFEDCLKNSLHDKTVLLVTDQIKFLEQCDEIYFIEKGTILLKGKHMDLMEFNEKYKDFIQYLEKQRTICKDKSNLFDIAADIPNSQAKMFNESETDPAFAGSKDSLFNSDVTDNIIKMNDSKAETYALGNVFKTYFSYFGNCFSFVFLCCAQIVNATIISCLPVYFIFTLVYYEYYIMNFSIYLGLFLWMSIFGIFMNIYFNKKMFTASKLFHNDFMKKMYRSTFAFFQNNSFGIISTISVQLQLTDYDIPYLIQNTFLNFFVAIMTSCIILFTSPWYIIFILFITIILILITRFVRKALLSYNRYDMKYKDILYTQVLNMLVARPIIQAYDKMDFISKRLYDTYDEYITNLYIIHASKSWYSLITQCCTVLLIAFVGFAIVLLTPTCSLGNLVLHFYTDDNTSEEVTTKKIVACSALAIVCILQVCYVLQKCFVLYLNLGLSFDALIQVEKFKMNIDDEAPNDDDDDDDDYNEANNQQNNSEFNNENYRALIGQSLNIKFLNVVWYMEVPVLNMLTFNIRENEKVGFLGLTSSERKAIIAILYKLSNISSGSVKIGKRNIARFPIKHLRSLISVISAEPFLFNFSIKKILNEDKSYFSQKFSEVEVLQKFMLFERVNTLPNKMDSDADQFLNTEEKQILCLAGAYIQQSPIIIVEDYLSGSILEFILGSQLKDLFPQSIILIFANDVTGLRQCDTILTVKDGKVVNSDSFTNTLIKLDIIPESSF